MDRPTLIYDGECGFCRRAVAWYQAHDTDRRLTYLARQSPERSARFPQLDAPQYAGSMQLVMPDGSIRSGERAAATALSSLAARRWRWVGALLGIWGVRHGARIGYKWIAKNRYRFSCNDTTCPHVPPGKHGGA